MVGLAGFGTHARGIRSERQELLVLHVRGGPHSRALCPTAADDDASSNEAGSLGAGRAASTQSEADEGLCAIDQAAVDIGLPARPRIGAHVGKYGQGNCY